MTKPITHVKNDRKELNRSTQAADTFHEYYPTIASNAIFEIWKDLFPASIEV